MNRFVSRRGKTAYTENQFDSSFEAIGTANSENVIAAFWANAVTVGFQWWKVEFI